jgi:hypothetical protein
MSQRITRAMLDRKLEALNAATGQPLTYFAGDSREASIGHYYLEGSTCGGWQLNQVMNTSGAFTQSPAVAMCPCAHCMNKSRAPLK